MVGNVVHTNITGPDLTTHAVSYHRFMLAVKWIGITLGSSITFFTLAFATKAGFFAALIAGLVVFALGVFAMTHGLAHSTESDGPPA